METTRMLYTSAEIRDALIRMFKASTGRRVAIAAFVGSGAEAYLPKPEGIELVCWPKVGSTNPDAIRKLMKRGVRVSFADDLHMKLYWSETNGTIITSANLSTNALGAGSLLEVGVLLPPGQVRIDDVLRTIRMRPVSKKELRALDKSNDEYETRNRGSRRGSRAMSFLEWHDLPCRKDWGIGYWDSFGDFSATAESTARQEYGVAEPYDFIGCLEKSYKKSDWVLTFCLRDRLTRLEWLYVDYVARTPKDDKAYDRECPCQAVQIWRPSSYPKPPFQSDDRFRKALVAAIGDIGVTRFKTEDPVRPSKRLVGLIHRYYQA